jgi:hypothetical protein
MKTPTPNPLSRRAPLAILALASFFSATAATHAQVSLGGLKSAIGSSAPASDSGGNPNITSAQASGGLKDALSQGISTAVSSTGRPGGYFENAAIKILMPPKLKPVESALRAAGQGQRVDAFIKSMNAAAEEAAPEAKAILLEALKQMSFSDAKGIVTGGKTAGTDYFKRTTTEQIQAAFRPIVERAMAQTGVNEQFTALMSKAPSLPFGGKTPSLDINQYVLDKSTDGLFVVMGQEETRIRTDPAAQVTPLLKTVFGR